MQFVLSVFNIPIIQCAYASDRDERKKSERYQKQSMGFNANN